MSQPGFLTLRFAQLRGLGRVLMALLLLGPEASPRVAAAAVSAGSPRPSLQVLVPRDFQVTQRDRHNTARVRVHGIAPPTTDRVDLQVFTSTGPLDLPRRSRRFRVDARASTFEGSVRLPAGGWYRLEFRAFRPDSADPIETVVIEHVGVGEVFLVAGQSNSANHGSERQHPTSGLVAAFDGERWRLADDPQPGASGSAGSFVPAFGDALASRWGVPIGVVSIGVGATSVREWLPRGDQMSQQPTTGANVRPVGPHRWEATGQLFDRLVGRLKAMGPRGCRAVLWHQGESDAGQARSGYPADRQITGEQYVGFMRRLVTASQRDAGWRVPWMTAQTTYHSETDPADPEFRAAQARLWEQGVTLRGPDTDALRAEFRDGVHFNPRGLRHHGRLWAERVAEWAEAPSQRVKP